MKHILKKVADILGLFGPREVPCRSSFAFPNNLNDAIEERLHQVPSQTSKAERRLLYQFFSQLWTGIGDVVEIGPFLGGTSRAIALGMLHNPRRTDGKLLTFDRFRDYFDIARLSKYLQPLLDSGVLKPSDIHDLGARAPFIEVFKRVHQSSDYYECLEPRDNGVPDLPEDVATGEWMQLPEGLSVDAVFIDGCKSWFGTKYFMKLMAPIARPGATFLFQDFGWFTCFWLPAFVEIFNDALSLVGHVDNTYVFSLTRALSSQEVEKRFPDSPEELGIDELNRLFKGQINSARQRDDGFGEVRHCMHQAAALAYVGDKAQAREILRLAERLPQARYHKLVFEKVWESPTYTPTSLVMLGR